MKYLYIKENNVKIAKYKYKDDFPAGTLKKGNVVTELESSVKDGEVWHKIQTDGGLIGYIHGVSVYRVKLIQLQYTGFEKLYTINKINDNYWPLYTKPSVTNKTRKRLYTGSSLWIIDEIENSDGRWYKVRLPNKKEYYMDQLIQYVDDSITPPGLTFKSVFYELFIFIIFPIYTAFSYTIYKTVSPPAAVVSILVFILFWLAFGSKIIKRFYKMKK